MFKITTGHSFFPHPYKTVAEYAESVTVGEETSFFFYLINSSAANKHAYIESRLSADSARQRH